MKLFSKSRGKGKTGGTRSVSVARHLFIRVAFPVAIVFVGSFLILDRHVQAEVRGHIKREAVERDLDAQAARTNAEDRFQRFLAGIGGVAQVATALRTSGTGQDFGDDLYRIPGAGATPAQTFRRIGTSLQPVTDSVPATEARKLVEVGGEYYFLRSYPVAGGQVVTGRIWFRELSVGDDWYLLVRKGTVVRSSGLPDSVALKPGAALTGCANGAPDCRISVDGKPYLLLRSAATVPGQDLDVYLIQPMDLASSPILGTIRNLMIVGAVFSFLGAIGIAIFASRSLSRPLEELTNSCAKAQGAGQFGELQITPSRIAEIDALTLTLQGAVNTIEDGQRRLSQAYFQFMGAIVSLLDARDAYTAGHSHRVSAYSEALARDFGLSKQEVDDIRIGALLHDIGKIGVPDEVLRKHERLTKEEFDLMKQHPTIGRRVLEQIAHFDKYLDAVELHHENLDGTGYPRGLRGEQIPVAARIVKVADVYDALSTDRPYRKAMSREEVHDVLRKGSGSHFDRMLVEIFLTRSVPSFEPRTGLEQLHRAIGVGTQPAKKAVGAG